MAVIASISAAGIPSAAIISMNMLFMSVGLPLDIIAFIEREYNTSVLLWLFIILILESYF